MNRRQYLSTVSTGVIAGLAGCGGQDPDEATMNELESLIKSEDVNLDHVTPKNGSDVIFADWFPRNITQESISNEIISVASAWSVALHPDASFSVLDSTCYTLDYVGLMNMKIDSEWAYSFHNDEMSADEYSSKIDETVTFTEDFERLRTDN
ncbi:hypothetical protein KU306_16870 (plasmid) [Haloferax larsenii]|uniref:DUF8159 domain-containing protein n=1 Tax=Haloferax larsenii TaxID=302484 RepID=A0ABY5RIK4_HALLR|nr:hypothetical protein [Haloferax larsenii]UVE51994.1 hypothetical protein KU306_16870 [Haloferax larsenii]